MKTSKQALAIRAMVENLIKIERCNFAELWIIGIDPAVAKPNAIAIFNNEKLVDHGKGLSFLDMALDQIRSRKKSVIVGLEVPYLGINPQASLKLAEQCGIIKNKYQQFPIIDILATSWMSAIKIKTKRSKSRDEHLIKLGEFAHGCFANDIDIACAVHIGAHLSRRIKSEYLN